MFVGVPLRRGREDDGVLHAGLEVVEARLDLRGGDGEAFLVAAHGAIQGVEFRLHCFADFVGRDG